MGRSHLRVPRVDAAGACLRLGATALAVYLACSSVELVTVVPDFGNQVTRLLRTQSVLLGEIFDLIRFATRNAAAITAVGLALVVCHCVSPIRSGSKTRRLPSVSCGPRIISRPDLSPQSGWVDQKAVARTDSSGDRPGGPPAVSRPLSGARVSRCPRLPLMAGGQHQPIYLADTV